jgi:mannose-6-phosphate isomerase
MNANYPLRFAPIFRRALWGGRRLETVLGKTLPAGDDFAESWEIVDHGTDQSRVLAGPLQGTELGRLVRTRHADLLGPHDTCDHFPLLLKFLDVGKNLSVQVHPNDEQAALLDPPDGGKSEAWYVLHVEPGSRIYAGLRPGVDPAALARAIAHGEIERCLDFFQPSAGDCVLIPAGTVHALGAGLLVVEIQQASDTTFRLFDWNRLGPDGRPRPLHVGQALDAIDYQAGPARPVTPQSTAAAHVERLIVSDKFVVDRWTFSTPRTVGGDQRCHIVVPVSGCLRLERDAAPSPLGVGQAALVPAAAGPLEIEPAGSVVMLDMYVPEPPYLASS